MKTKQELFQTKEYWIDELQNEIYRQVSDFMKKNELNQIQLANQLGVSKGYVSQILNGDCNFTLKKIVELSLALGKAPIVNYVDTKEYFENQKYSHHFLKNSNNLFPIVCSNNTNEIFENVNSLSGFSIDITKSNNSNNYEVLAA